MQSNGNTSKQSPPRAAWKTGIVLALFLLVVLLGAGFAFVVSTNDDIGALTLRNVLALQDQLGMPKDTGYLERLDTWLRSAIAQRKPLTARFLADKLMSVTTQAFGDASPQNERACVLASAAYAPQDASSARSFYMRGARNLAKSSWELHALGKNDEALGMAQFLVQYAAPDIQNDNKFYNRAIIEVALCEQERGNMDAGQSILRQELDANEKRHDRDTETTRFYLGCLYCSNKPKEAVVLLQQCLSRAEKADIAVNIDDIEKQLKAAQALCKNAPAVQSSVR